MTLGARKNDEKGEPKLEDILRSIRGIIDNNQGAQYQGAATSQEQDHPDESILELTSELIKDSAPEEEFISKEVINQSAELITNFVKEARDRSYAPAKSEMDGIITGLIKPLLKEWLDNNLQRIVEKVIAGELQKLRPKNNL